MAPWLVDTSTKQGALRLTSRCAELARRQPGQVVRAQTLAVMEGLDLDRRSTLLQFFYESCPIREDNPVVGLVAANQSMADPS